MKKLVSFIIICFLLAGCEMNSGSTKSKVDSTVNKLDSTFERIEDRAGEAWDSTKEKAKDFKEGLDSTFRKRDTTKN